MSTLSSSGKTQQAVMDQQVSPTSPGAPVQAYAQLTASPHATQPVAGPSRGAQHLPPPKLISTHLADHPDHAASKAIHTQFPRANPLIRLFTRFRIKHSVIEGLSDAELKKWEAEGPRLRQRAGWKLEGEDGDGVVVSELFWKMYLSCMPTLERDKLSGLCPPDLLGSTTTIPLTIISLIPDIMQHYRDVILRAREEIFLATNYWQPSNSVNTISQALRDLSALVLKEKRKKVVVKVMYDRGSWEQLWNAHAPVTAQEWVPLDLPKLEDVQGLELEVINFHRVLLGTFHAKFMVVDRKVALINSNNIQDRPNLELMSHLEGPIVDSFYEVALHSWYNKLEPPLPCINKPYQPPTDSEGNIRYLFQDHNPYFDDIEILKAARAARRLLRRQTKDMDDERAQTEEHGIDRLREAVRQAVDKQRQNFTDWKPGERLDARAHIAMSELREFRERLAGNIGMGTASRAGSRSNSRGPSRRSSTTDVNRTTYTDKETAAITAQNAALGPAVDPSEAPSTPTMVNDVPPKAMSYPQPGMPMPTLGAESKKPKEKGHVLFLDTSAVDGSGRLFENEGGIVNSPSVIALNDAAHPDTPRGSVRHVRLLDPQGPIVSSPTASSLHLPQDGHPPRSPLEPMEREGRLDVPAQASVQHDVTDDNGEPLPLSARMPNEIEGKSPVIASDKADPQVDKELAAATGGIKIDTELADAALEGRGSKRMVQLSKMFNAAGVLSEAWATVEDSDELDNFRPHIVHKPHDPFPIAMCNRKPHGFPGHHDIRNPQNAAWLAGFRYAKKKVFIQTPTLNARPIVRAVKQSCRRGVEVVLLLDLGFNDKGESIPFQGGTNEEVVDRLYKILSKEKKNQYLKVYWYTGKDQVRPLNAVKKQRNCHIKFACYDDEVLIIGNGNQDSQSWFHSQEVNVMIDSKQHVAEMMETLVANQNTMKYGLVDPDGVWRDNEGKTLRDWGATEGGAFRGLSGFINFAKTI